VKIFNINGQLVNDLLNDYLAAGDHRLRWNGQNDDGQRVASGIYFCRLEHGGRVIAAKMLLVK
jgi:flagellar hook assembly protein FlgD